MEGKKREQFARIQKTNRSHSSCAGGGCTNTRQKNPELSFFQFPKDLKRCLQWMQNSRRLYPNKKPEDVSGNSAWQMCEEHFEASQFMNPAEKGVPKKHKRLMPNAIPILFNIPNSPLPVTLTGKLLTCHALPMKKKGKTLANILAKSANDIDEKSVIFSGLPISGTKIKQRKVILPSNNQVVPMIETLHIAERKRNCFDSNENSSIEEYYKTKLKALNKKHYAKLDSINREYLLRIKFLIKEHEYKLALLKLKMKYKVSKCLK